MLLRSTRRDNCSIPAANLRVNVDEDETHLRRTVRTRPGEEIPEMAARTGFRCEGQWIDADGPSHRPAVAGGVIRAGF